MDFRWTLTLPRDNHLDVWLVPAIHQDDCKTASNVFFIISNIKQNILNKNSLEKLKDFSEESKAVKNQKKK